MGALGHIVDHVSFAKVAGTISLLDAIYPLSRIPAAAWAKIRTDGGNLYATNSAGTRLPAKVQWINHGSQDGEMIILYDSLSPTVNTEVQIHLDTLATTEPGKSSPYGEEAVFNDYLFRLSLDEASSPFVDSSPEDFSVTTFDVGAQVAGPVRYGRTFDGINDGLLLPSGSTQLHVTTAFTLMQWIKKAVGGEGDFYNSTSTKGGVKNGVSIGNRSGSVLNVYIGDGTASWINSVSTTTLSTGVWTFIAVTFDGSNLRFYKNGLLDDTVARSATVNWHPDMNIKEHGIMGNHRYSGSRGTTVCPGGDADDIRYRGDTLSSPYIQTLYNNQNDPGSFYTGTPLWVPVTSFMPFFIGGFIS